MFIFRIQTVFFSKSFANTIIFCLLFLTHSPFGYLIRDFCVIGLFKFLVVFQKEYSMLVICQSSQKLFHEFSSCKNSLMDSSFSCKILFLSWEFKIIQSGPKKACLVIFNPSIVISSDLLKWLKFRVSHFIE